MTVADRAVAVTMPAAPATYEKLRQEFRRSIFNIFIVFFDELNDFI